jgi:hypothetical protein
MIAETGDGGKLFDYCRIGLSRVSVKNFSGAVLSWISNVPLQDADGTSFLFENIDTMSMWMKRRIHSFALFGPSVRRETAG